MTPHAAQTLALALGIGSAVTLISRRVSFPPILPLLLVGLGLGSSGLNLVDGSSLGDGLGGLITVSICLLIFEGSLHLDRRTLGRAPRAVWGLLTIGTIVTWLGTALLARLIIGLEWDSALMIGSVLIVTGPTVIQPILRRITLMPNLDAALKAEGILIDPIGAVAAIATLEIIVAGHNQHDVTGLALVWLYAGPFVYGAVVGLVVGFLGARLIATVDPDHTESEARQNLLAMATCMIAVGLSEWLTHESGLIAATICGIVVARTHLVDARSLHHFKEQISVLLVGGLFILLASRFDLAQLRGLDMGTVLFLGGMILLVRPIGALLSTFRSVLTVRERMFIALTAPRGIVAASVASIVALSFANTGSDRLAADGALIETLVFTVIVLTVAIAGIGTSGFATLLRVRLGHPSGVVLVGAHRLGRDLGTLLKQEGIEVMLVDTNPMRISSAATAGLPAHLGDATEHRWMDEEVLGPTMGWIFAATGNADVDRVITRWGASCLGVGHVFRWCPEKEDGADAAQCALAGGRPLNKLQADLDTDRLSAQVWTGSRDGAIPFGVLKDGSFRIVGTGAEIAERDKVIGLAPPDTSPPPESESA